MEQDRLVLLAGLAFVLAISIFVLWGPSNLKRKRLKGQVGGLVNLGNSCFLNALLQAFGSCPSVVSWLSNYEQVDPGGLVSALFLTLKVINGEHPENKDDPFAPHAIMDSLKARWNITPGEQDAHELFIVLIDAVEDEIGKCALPKECSLKDALDSSETNNDVKGHHFFVKGTKTKKDSAMRTVQSEISQMLHKKPRLSQHRLTESLSNSVNSTLPSTEVTSPFQGLLTSGLQCTNCDHKNVVQCDKFECLSLPLPGESERRHTLEQLIDTFVATEIVKMTCDKCKLSEASVRKKLNFGKLPACLCIHIVRTTWLSDGRPSKRMDHVDFPEQLVMDGYTYAQRGGDTDRKRHMYQLKAVVVHKGDVERGHFVTYRPSKYSWVLVSDTDVIECSKSDALAASPYMLLYDKR